MTNKRVYTKTQERLDTTDAAARDIVAKEKLASESKTARLREARLKKEADDVELPAAESKRKHRKKGPIGNEDQPAMVESTRAPTLSTVTQPARGHTQPFFLKLSVREISHE